MASKLERMIQPDERVVFRTRLGWRPVVKSFVLGVAVTGGIWGLLYWIQGEEHRLVSAIIGGSLSVVTLLAYGSEVLVTNMRVLHRTGVFKPQVLEVPLWHIERLERITGYVTLRDRGGKTIELHSVPDSEGLAAAIVAETGVAAPKLAPARVRAWDNFAAYFSVGCGIGMLFLLMAGLTHWDWDSLEQSLGDVGYLGYLGYLLVLIFIPIMLASLVLGFTVGMVLLMPALRLSLPLEEARAFFNSEERSEADEAPKWISFSARVPTWVARRLASRLYGAPV